MIIKRKNQPSQEKKQEILLEGNEDFLIFLNDYLERHHTELLINAMTDLNARKEIKNLLLTVPETLEVLPDPKEEFAELAVADFVGNGVIEKILQDYEDVTDIGFNGRVLTVETNSEKFIYDKNDITENYIIKIIQRFAMRENKEFNHGNPQFNGYSNGMRISASHKEISPSGTTMSLRITKPSLALNDLNFEQFAPFFIRGFLQSCVQTKCNLMLSGETGAGKTELQKLLISDIPFSERICMIEDTYEVHADQLFPDKDIISWITAGKIGITEHIKQALRFNPKWIIVSETRGSEAYEMFQSILSGHKIITTLHSISNEAVPSRFASMSSMGYKINEDMVKSDFLRYVDLGVHIAVKEFKGKKYRYIDEIVEFSEPKNHVLFKQNLLETDQGVQRTVSSFSISEKLKEKFAWEGIEFVFPIHSKKVDFPFNKTSRETLK